MRCLSMRLSPKLGIMQRQQLRIATDKQCAGPKVGGDEAAGANLVALVQDHRHHHSTLEIRRSATRIKGVVVVATKQVAIAYRAIALVIHHQIGVILSGSTKIFTGSHGQSAAARCNIIIPDIIVGLSIKLAGCVGRTVRGRPSGVKTG